MTKAQLNALLAKNQIRELITQLQLICSISPNTQYANELTLLISRYHTFMEKVNQYYAADRDVVLAQIKGAFQNLIDHLELPTGDQNKQIWIKNRQVGFLKQFVKSPWGWSLLILMLCGNLIAFSQIRLLRTEFHLEAKVRHLYVCPLQKWNIGAGYDLFLKRLEIEYASTLNIAPDLAKANTETFLSITQGRIQLNALPIAKGQSFTLDHDKGELILSLAKGETTLEADLMESQLYFDATNAIIRLGHPDTGEESVTIKTAKAPKIWINPCDTCTFHLPDLQIDSIDFKFNSGEKFESGILQGLLTIGSRSYKIEQGDWLTIASLDAARLKIHHGEDGMRIELDALASTLHHQDLRRIKNLLPSWLDFFWTNQMFFIYLLASNALFLTILYFTNFFKDNNIHH